MWDCRQGETAAWSGKEVLLAGVFGFAAFKNFLGFIDELADIAEFAIDGSEAHVGDGIEPAEEFHDRFADEMAGDFPLVGARDLFLNSVDEFGDIFRGNGPFVAGLLDAAEELVAVKRDAGSVFFDDLEADGFFDAFVSGVAAFAALADPPTTDCLAVLDRSRINDAVFVVRVAERATHEHSSGGFIRCGYRSRRGEERQPGGFPARNRMSAGTFRGDGAFSRGIFQDVSVQEVWTSSAMDGLSSADLTYHPVWSMATIAGSSYFLASSER